MPDRDGYPTKDELQAILDFEGTPAEFVEYINSIWWHDGFRVERGFDDYTGVKRCFLSTWGWSGNEEAISVLKQTWFWMLWWRESRRGGHYTFEVPTKQWWDKKFEVGKFGLPHSKVEPDTETDPFDYVESCEPDCSKERHAYHQGQWDMAGRINKDNGYQPHPGLDRIEQTNNKEE